MSALVLSGCGTYLHRASLETQTKAVHDNVAALSAPAYLAAQKQWLTDTAKREDQALATYLASSRDYSLLNIIQPASGSAPGSRGDRLRAAVEFQLEKAAGIRSLDQAQRRRLMTAPAIQATLENTRSSSAPSISDLADDYRRRGGTGTTDCPAVNNNAAIPADPAAAQIAYRSLRKACAAADPKIAAAVARSACNLDLVNSPLDKICGEIDESQNPISAKRKKDLGGVVSALKKRLERPARADLQKAAADAIAEGEAALDAATANAGYKDALDALGKLLAIDLSGELGRLTAAVDSPKVVAWKAETKAILGLIDAIDTVAADQGPPLDEPSALLIGIAKVQHDLNLVTIDIDEQSQRAVLLRQKAAASRTQLHYLARSQAALCPNIGPCTARTDNKALSEALSYFLSAYNQGLAPSSIYDFRLIQVSRIAIVRRAQATEADYRALIQPAVDQLAAYGEGGIKAETLGTFLGSLPVTAAIIGK
ncbi:MAG: hypothetical protein JWN66_298 [Sphingomonas bacterium]|uniref:hypothetical protein n=1 Tax=Sphingomonas bacterium TaxID=1895847 RepID=UPI0026056652|nr:hypothetical protein [Sphingomonas bacterium]MDB5703182.1 hypothetical protein [Sphingomonas bacterium]